MSDLATIREKVGAMNATVYNGAVWLRKSDVLAILEEYEIDYSKIKLEPLLEKPCLHDKGVGRVKGESPHCVIHGCEAEVNERKVHRRAEKRRGHDVYPGDENRKGNYGIYGRRSAEDRRHHE